MGVSMELRQRTSSHALDRCHPLWHRAGVSVRLGLKGRVCAKPLAGITVSGIGKAEGHTTAPARGQWWR
jgi:hypothetical protein